MAKLCIIREINSAHGSKIHGHTFRIEFHFCDKVINRMVGNLDFHEIEPQLESVLAKLDKTYIDDVIQMRGTVENIAIFLLRELDSLSSLQSVVVWEGKDKYVEVFRDDLL